MPNHIDLLKVAVKATDDAANAVIDAHVAAREAAEVAEADHDWPAPAGRWPDPASRPDCHGYSVAAAAGRR